MVIGNDLASSLKTDLDREKKSRSVRGIRHQLGLKVRGQRTRTTGRKHRTVGVQRTKAMQKPTGAAPAEEAPAAEKKVAAEKKGAADKKGN